jgi:hypothetical protein
MAYFRSNFAAWEQPGLFSAELRAAFRPLRQALMDTSLRANGSRERAPDDSGSNPEATGKERIASSQELLAMTAAGNSLTRS